MGLLCSFSPLLRVRTALLEADLVCGGVDDHGSAGRSSCGWRTALMVWQVGDETGAGVQGRLVLAGRKKKWLRGGAGGCCACWREEGKKKSDEGGGWSR